MGGKRQAGWPSLLVTFLLATQEKSDSEQSVYKGAGDRPRFALNAARASRTGCAPAGHSSARAAAFAGMTVWGGAGAIDLSWFSMRGMPVGSARPTPLATQRESYSAAEGRRKSCFEASARAEKHRARARSYRGIRHRAKCDACLRRHDGDGAVMHRRNGYDAPA
jgi:hypothetical protein